MKRSADWEPCVNRPKSCPEPVELCALSLSNGASRRFDTFT